MTQVLIVHRHETEKNPLYPKNLKAPCFYCVQYQEGLKILHFLLDERSINVFKDTTGKKAFNFTALQAYDHVYHLCTKFR